MSYTKIDNAIFEDKNLRHTEFRVLVFLIRNYNTSKGYAFPTRKQIVESCNINKDTLSSVLNSLESKGYITRKTNPFRAGRNNIYYIHRYLVGNNYNEKEVDESEVIISKAPAIAIEPIEDEDLKQKIETVECTIGRKIKRGFKNILSKLSWDELVKIDMSLIGKNCNESYYLGAIYRLRPDLRSFG